MAEVFVHACQHGRTEVVRWFLDRGLNPDAAPYRGRTGLHWAIMHSQLEVVRLLLERAACPCADISTTIARRSLTGSLAVRPIRCNRRPSATVTGRTNTSGGRPVATSENSRKQPDRNPAKDQLHEQRSWTRH
jgi:ankyrin repeat protein